jgi:hypothetical protein
LACRETIDGGDFWRLHPELRRGAGILREMRPMSFAKREIQGQNALRIAIDMKKYRRDMLVMAVIAVFLTFMNPFNATGQLSFPLALLYWFAMIFVGGAVGEVGMRIYDQVRPQGPVWGMLTVASITSALAVSGFIIAIETVFNRGVPMLYWPRIYGLVLIISIGISLITYITERAFHPQDAVTTASSPTDKFMQRLPVKFRTAALHAIASEDHYLRVYTSMGEELILMRLADAVRELGGADGIQVHRSWWIAKAGITDEKKQDGRTLLILESGTEVPVSRSYRAKAKEVGFIA